MAIFFRGAMHSTEVRTRLDVRIGWLADLEIDEATGKLLRIGVESVPHVPISLVWIPVAHIYEWTKECIRVDDAMVEAKVKNAERVVQKRRINEMPVTPTVRYDNGS